MRIKKLTIMKKIIVIGIVFCATFSLAQNLTFADNDLKKFIASRQLRSDIFFEDFY